jgi:hypothetical protein
MYRDEEQKHNDGPWQRWRDGRLASQPGMATVVLAVVLLFTILAAQLLVSAHADYSHAVENGYSLIRQVSEKGLGHYLSPKTSVQYHIIESDGKPARFTLTITESHLAANDTYEIVHMAFNSQGWPVGQDRLTIENNLVRYKYETKSYTIIKKPQGFFQDGNFPQEVQILDPANSNLIPSLLLDFFSSAAAKENFSDGVILDFPDQIHRVQGFMLVFNTVRVWVRPEGKIPPEILKAHPNGHSMHVEQQKSRDPFVDSSGKKPDINREIYCNDQHQLVWEKDNTTEEIKRSVTQKELIETFKDAALVILKRMNIQIESDEKSNDEEVL